MDFIFHSSDNPPMIFNQKKKKLVKGFMVATKGRHNSQA